jgi:hypothetical protein
MTNNNVFKVLLPKKPPINYRTTNTAPDKIYVCKATN